MRVLALTAVLTVLGCGGGETSFRLAEFPDGRHGYRITCTGGIDECTAEARELCTRFVIRRVPAADRMEVECASETPREPVAAEAPSKTAAADAVPTTEKIARRALKSTVLIRAGAQLGSGFVIPGGLVVTNLHVVAGESSIFVKYPSGREFQVQDVRGFDTTNDLAVLNTNTKNPALGLSKKAQAPGAPVVVVANPLGLEGSVSAGVVSGVRKDPNRDWEVMQLDAAISPGSSGGPVLDRRGKVVGVVVGFNKNGQNVNFAVPIRFVARILKQSKGPIAMSTFSVATAPSPPPPPPPPAPTAATFPEAVAGLRFGWGIADAAQACLAKLSWVGGDTWVCPISPVSVPYAEREAFFVLNGGVLVRVAVHAKTSEIMDLMEQKYPDPAVYAKKAGKWVQVAPDKLGRGRAFMKQWSFDKGSWIQGTYDPSNKPTPYFVMWVSRADKLISEQNY